MKDNEEMMWRVRGMFANHAMKELWDDTRKLVDVYGVDGAELYLETQMKFLRQIREIDSGDDN